MSETLCELAALAEMWGADVRMRRNRGMWRVSVVDARGRTLVAVQNARLAFAVTDALRDMLALDAGEREREADAMSLPFGDGDDWPNF